MEKEDRTQADHEAAARLMEEMGFRVVEVHQKLSALDIPVCQHTHDAIAALIAAALSEAVRVAVAQERARCWDVTGCYNCAALMPSPWPKYDPAFGDDVLCGCGHAYYRHFDTYEEMAPVGCKYCDCRDWRSDAQATPAPVATPERLQE